MQDDTIELHIRAACRPGIETERLLGDLTAYCWPGGTQDHTDPVARGWLRHFQTVRPIGTVPECACNLEPARPHCSLCN